MGVSTPIHCPHCDEEVDWADIHCKNLIAEQNDTQEGVHSSADSVEVTFEVDADIFAEFEKICEQEGITVEQAINMFLIEVVRTGDIPFPIKL